MNTYKISINLEEIIGQIRGVLLHMEISAKYSPNLLFLGSHVLELIECRLEVARAIYKLTDQINDFRRQPLNFHFQQLEHSQTIHCNATVSCSHI
jgi:hypothetical protein